MIKNKKIFSIDLLTVFLFFLVIIVFVGFIRAYYQNYIIKQEISNLRQEILNLEHKKFASLKMLEYVNSDEFVEKKARTEFNMKRPEEKIVFINRVDNENNLNKQKNKDINYKNLKNAIKWWYYFIHKDLN